MHGSRMNRPSRPLLLTLLLFSNIGPGLLASFDAPWALAPLVYCAGNALWIAAAEPRSSDDLVGRSDFPQLWAQCLLMTLGAICWAPNTPLATREDSFLTLPRIVMSVPTPPLA